MGKKLNDIQKTRSRWDERADRYDGYYQVFKGAVEQYVEWELLKSHLPADKGARILDAAGGTGRMTVLLAKIGYPISLCDLSFKMLQAAKRKLHKEGLLDKVTISQGNVFQLPFPKEYFDFILCWGGEISAIEELARVTKKKGRISLCLAGRSGVALNEFHKNPQEALALLTAKSDYCRYEDEKYRVFNAVEVETFIEKAGVHITGIYAYNFWNILFIPEEVLNSPKWEAKFFKQTTELMLRLAKDPAVRGVSKHLMLYGEKN